MSARQSGPGGIELRNANTGDYQQILRLNSAAVPDVNLIDETTLRHLHSQAAALLVASESNTDKLAGFLLIIADGADYDSPNYQFFAARYPNFHYVDRVVVSPEHQRMGIGKRFYDHLFELADGDPVTCEVNVVPSNQQSMNFHRQLGFKSVGEQTTEGGSKRVALLARTGLP